MNACPFCSFESDGPLLPHIAECEHAPEEIRSEAKDTMSRRAAFAKAPSPCCKLRKKILVRLAMFTEADSGISDAEVADVMTFDRINGRDAITFKFCPWCGKPWVRIGVEVM